MKSDEPKQGPWADATEAVTGQDSFVVRQIRLRIVEGDDEGVVFEARGDRASVGTHASNDFQLTDPTVSRFHCEIEIKGGTAVIRDLDSRNGTYVGLTRVHAAELRDGSELLLGRTRVKVDMGNQVVRVPLSDKHSFGGLVGRSTAMRQVFAILDRAAQTTATVLIGGETGVGKGLAAESIHDMGDRADGPFVVVDCGAIPANLAESMLFGHEKGAFTGAVERQIGAFEAASGGTLFLDEIGELAIDLQPKLLRALEERQISRVGSTQRIEIDVRVIAASNRSLQSEVNAKRFRADLYFRLAVLEVRIPALRDRSEDIPPLLERLVTKLAPSGDDDAARELLDPAFVERLRSHRWPGNVRELRNYVERCLAMREVVAPGTDVGPMSSSQATESGPKVDISVPLRDARAAWVRTFEREYLQQLLESCGGNVSAAARAAKVDRVHLYRLLNRAGLR